MHARQSYPVRNLWQISKHSLTTPIVGNLETASWANESPLVFRNPSYWNIKEQLSLIETFRQISQSNQSNHWTRIKKWVNPWTDPWMAAEAHEKEKHSGLTGEFLSGSSWESGPFRLAQLRYLMFLSVDGLHSQQLWPRMKRMFAGHGMDRGRSSSESTSCFCVGTSAVPQFQNTWGNNFFPFWGNFWGHFPSQFFRKHMWKQMDCEGKPLFCLQPI